MASIAPPLPRYSWLQAMARGFHVCWKTLALLVAINTAIAAVLWNNDTRPFWHPLLSAQLMGFAIAYCVNVAAPWERARPFVRIVVASAAGSLIGIALTILLKGYTQAYVMEHWHNIGWSAVSGFCVGVIISLIFVFKFQEVRATTALHKAEAERHLLSKQAIEAQLKLMQAQIEPHFLFNTLASVQYLTETDPKEAHRLLSHLIDYLRAALPQMRASSTTLGKELGFSNSFLNILKMRMGERLAFTVETPSAALLQHPFPPNMLICLVENAIKHGVEPSATGGRIDVTVRRIQDELVIDVVDTGRGPNPGQVAAGHGIGLANVRERLAALYGARGKFTLSAESPQGTRATMSIPFEA